MATTTFPSSPDPILPLLSSYRTRVSARNKSVCRQLILHAESRPLPATPPPSSSSTSSSSSSSDPLAAARARFVCDHLGLSKEDREGIQSTDDILARWEELAPNAGLDGTGMSVTDGSRGGEGDYEDSNIHAYRRGVESGLRDAVSSFSSPPTLTPTPTPTPPFPPDLWTLLSAGVRQLAGPNARWRDLWPQGPGIACAVDLAGDGELSEGAGRAGVVEMPGEEGEFEAGVECFDGPTTGE